MSIDERPPVQEQINADYRKYSIPETLSYNWQGRKLSIITSLCLVAAAGIIGGAAIYFTPFMSSAAIATLITAGVLVGSAMTVKLLMGTPYKMEREPQSVDVSHEPLSFFKVLLYKIQLNWAERKVEIITSAIFTISILAVGLTALYLLPSYALVSLAAITTVTASGGAAFTLYFLLKRPQRPTDNVNEPRVFSGMPQNASSNSETPQSPLPNLTNYPDLYKLQQNPSLVQQPTETSNNVPKALNIAQTPLQLDPLPTIAIQREALFYTLSNLGFENINFLKSGSIIFDSEAALDKDLFKIFNNLEKYHKELNKKIFLVETKDKVHKRVVNTLKNSFKNPAQTYSEINGSFKKAVESKYPHSQKLLLTIFTKLWVHYIQSLPGTDASLPSIQNINDMSLVDFPQTINGAQELTDYFKNNYIHPSNLDLPQQSFTVEGVKCYLQALITSSTVGIKRNIEFHTFNFSSLKDFFTEDVIHLIGQFLTVVQKAGEAENRIILDFKNNPLTIAQMNYLLGKVLENTSTQLWTIRCPYKFPIDSCANYQEILWKGNVTLELYNPTHQELINIALSYMRAYPTVPLSENDPEN